MKKLMKAAISLMAGLMMALTGTVVPAANIAAAQDNKIRLSVNENVLTFLDAQPFKDENGRIQVPMRRISEALGGTLEWNADDKKITIKKDESVIVLLIDEKTINKDGSTIEMDTAAMIKDGRTYVPVRFVAEAFGAEVEWVSAKNSVAITIDIPFVDIGKGYLVPSNSEVDTMIMTNDVNKVELYMTYMPLEDTEKNMRAYEEMRGVLARKFGDEVADQIYDAIKGKKTLFDNVEEKTVYVKETDQIIWFGGSVPYNFLIQIVVYEPGVK